MAKRRSRRGSKLTQSYNAYKANRKKWISKGYTMEEQLSKKEYKKYYEQAKQLGEQNIAREFASAERMYSMREAQRLRKEAIYQGIDKEDLPTVQEIIGTSSRKEIFDWWLDNIAEGDYSRRDEFEAIYG